MLLKNHRLLTLSLFLIGSGLTSLALFQSIAPTLDVQGYLHEPFALIPIGWLLIAIGCIISIIHFFWDFSSKKFSEFLRVLYYFDGEQLVLLASLFKKSDQENIDAGEKAEFRKWEQYQRDPDSISRAYLKCIQNDPELIRDLVNR